MNMILFVAIPILLLVSAGTIAYGGTARAADGSRLSGSSEATDAPQSRGRDSRSRSRTPDSVPQSHVPPRSPDLGSPTFPLSPSIGPGSGLLGPEGGRAPSRLKAEPEQDRATAGRKNH